MYELIEAHPSPRTRYTEALVREGDLTADEARGVGDDFRARLDAAFSETHQSAPPDASQAATPDAPSEPRLPAPQPDPSVRVATNVERWTLERVIDGLMSRPEGFTVHPKLERILQAHRVEFEKGEVDWSLAESFAFGSLLLEGTPVRLAGQDTRRGTFSQRHGVLIDQRTEEEYVPLAHLAPDQAPFMLYDTVLSEYAALGFEYGYSVDYPDALVLWEAQFGDFVNEAQVVLDQFVSSAEDKWGQASSLGLLLPHGFEGQGPEHSSARMERFLDLCAEDNMRVVYPSTAAQYFHVLRRQALATRRGPLVFFTPKPDLRAHSTRSQVSQPTRGGFR